jgi:hypothetical protein
MIAQEELAHAGAGAPAIVDGATSWHSCSSEELRAIAGRGIHAGDLYFAAVAELERRAKVSEETADAERAESALRRRRIIIWLAALFAAVDAVVALRFLGF